ncbi:MAG: hypothetical protein HY360_21520 [Verrucomicrobia bacterium]|nr:hypothetical protein [Verrucomicrobiota bacterium]
MKATRITRVYAHEVVVPAKPGAVNSPVFNSDARWDLLPVCLIAVTADDGLTGFGEVGRGVSLDQIRPWLEQLPGVEIQGWSFASLPASWRGSTLHGLLARHPPALWHLTPPLGFALETALLDLAGKRLGCRIADLLGGAYVEKIPVYYWCARQTPEDIAKTARTAKSRGFGGIKIKSKLGDPVIEQVRAIQDAAGREFHITIDPMFQWCSPLDTLALLKQLEALGGNVIVEDPFPQDMPEFWHRARSVCAIPLMWHARTLDILRVGLQARCADGFNCGGGLVEFLTCAHAVEVAGYSCWHGTAIELGIGHVAKMHAAAAARSCVLASDFVSPLVREHTLIRWDWPYREGFLPLPSGTGLGVELDLDMVERYKKNEAVFSR